MSNIIAVYPGTFDPFTFGHLDIAERALSVCDKLIVGIAVDSNKANFFSCEERKAIAENELRHVNSSGKIQVEVFSGLLISFAQKMDAHVIIRGLRAVSDFEYEFQMSCMNTKLDPHIETIFLPASEKTHFISSRLVKEVVRLGGDVTSLVSSDVKNKLENYFKKL